MTTTAKNTPEEWRLAELNQSIERLQAETTALEAERAPLARSARREGRRLSYLHVAKRFRAPAERFALWEAGLLTIGPLIAGIVLLVVVDLAFGSLSLAVLAFLVGAAAGALALAALLYRPADAALLAEIQAADAAYRLSESRLKEIAERLARAKGRQRDLIEERRALVASGQVQRAALLQRPWKAMPEAEWEDFVVEACRTLGASVERLPRSGDKDANLLADFGDRRVAIATFGEGHIAKSSAVQHALAGRQRHATERCAVILNRRLTGAAQDFARHNDCRAIGVEEFPDFVMGKLEI